MEPALPPIEVLSFTEERPGFGPRPPSGRVYRSRFRRWDEMATVAGRIRRRYETTIGLTRGFSPRMQSRVEHRLDCRAGEVVDALGLRFAYDPVEHEYRAPTELHLRWSWPRLPVWLAVAELSSTRSALRLSLRSRRRFRYPMRYFHAAHSTLTGIESTLGAARH